MADDATFHRTLSRYSHSSFRRVNAHLLMTNHRGDNLPLGDNTHSYWIRPDQDFNKYATNWEKAHSTILGGHKVPVVDATSMVLGYYGWYNAGSIWVPTSAPEKVKLHEPVGHRHKIPGGYPGGLISVKRKDKLVTTMSDEVRLDLSHLVNNEYVNREYFVSVKLKGGPYPVYISESGNPFGNGSYKRWGAPEESYHLLTDLDGRVIAVTEYDVGGNESPSDSQILISTIFKVLGNVHLRNPLIKSFTSGLWPRS